MINNTTTCILDHKRVELSNKTPINVYGAVWWWSSKSPVRLVYTGLHVDLRDKDLIAVLKRHPYEIQPIDILSIMEDIQERGISFVQVITTAIEPQEITQQELRDHFNMIKEVDLQLPVVLKDVVSLKTYRIISTHRNQLSIIEVK